MRKEEFIYLFCYLSLLLGTIIVNAIFIIAINKPIIDYSYLINITFVLNLILTFIILIELFKRFYIIRKRRIK